VQDDEEEVAGHTHIQLDHIGPFGNRRPESREGILGCGA
jgi:hypothetical protein